MSLFDRFRRRASPLELAQQEAAIENLKLQTQVARQRRETLERAYDASQPSQFWQRPGDHRSGNAVMDQARSTIRSWARYLDENHDLAIGVLDDICKKVIGCGIQITPGVKKPGGDLHAPTNEALTNLFGEWCLAMPEASRTLPWSVIETMVCRTLYRDGEMFIQHLEGNAPIRHRTAVPYSIELIEPDFVPFDLLRDSTPDQNRIVHGVELSDWKEPLGFYVYREHPGDIGLSNYTGQVNLTRDFKRVSADVMTHIKHTRRIGQVRGVSILHGVLRRLEDIKEYEESERIAARINAATCAAITKSTDFQGANNLHPDTNNRSMEFNPGMIFDNLLPGEKIEMIGAERPNVNLETFRDAQMRAVASGTGTSYSGISRNYNGTYSAQRQELVETWIGYELMREYLFGVFYTPLWQRFVRMAVMSGQLSTKGIDLATIFSVDFVGPKMPWIDPVKEIDAAVMAIDAGLTSRHMVVRENQLNPALVDEQIKNDPLRDLLKADKAAASAPATPEKPKQKPAADAAAA